MTPLLRTLFFFLVFWIHQILILPLLVVLFLRHKKDTTPGSHRFVHAITHSWGKMVCALGGARMTYIDRSGINPDEAVLFISNHQGDFDIPVLLAAVDRPMAYVAKKELAGIPLVSQWMRVMGCILLDRENRRKQVGQIRQTVDHLKSGISMVIFPEGTRSQSATMAEFAKGSLQVGIRAGVRLVPVTLRDTYTLYPKEKKLFPGGKATVIFHPAIDANALSKEELQGLQDTVKAQIQSGLDEPLSP